MGSANEIFARSSTRYSRSIWLLAFGCVHSLRVPQLLSLLARTAPPGQTRPLLLVHPLGPGLESLHAPHRPTVRHCVWTSLKSAGNQTGRCESYLRLWRQRESQGLGLGTFGKSQATVPFSNRDNPLRLAGITGERTNRHAVARQRKIQNDFFRP